MNFRILLLAFLLLPLKSFAYYYNDYEACCHPDRIHVDFDFIYWETQLNEVQFAALYDINGPNDTLSVEDDRYLRGEWEPGFRISGRYDNIFCCFDLFASYTWISGADSATAESVELAPNAVMLTTLGTNTTGSNELTAIAVKDDYLYQSADLLIGRHIFLNPCQSLYPFLGIEGMYLRQTLNMEARGDYNVDTRWHMRFWGLGFKAGVKYIFPILDCFDFFAKGTASILGGCAQTKLREDSPDGSFLQINFRTDEVQAVPGAHLQLGFSYQEYLFCCPVTLAFGYDFVCWWQHMAQFDTFFLNGIGGSDFFIPYALPSQTRDFSFQGLFIRAGLGF